MSGKLIWTDLSAYHPEQSKRFYARLLGWQFDASDPYGVAYQNEIPAAAIYEMPEFFQSIKMPSFWMPYFQTANLDAAVKKAAALGAKVEIEPTPLGQGDFALVRGPLGAGFSLFQGTDFDQSFRGKGGLALQSLFVSDIAPVADFYSALFEWQFEDIGSGDFKITSEDHDIAFAHVMSDELRSGKEFWANFFQPIATVSADEIEDAGGVVVGRLKFKNISALACHDPDGAYFLLLE